MSESDCVEDDAPNTQDLDYDMWEGQFEFVGPSEDTVLTGRGLQIITSSPHMSPRTNGIKKNRAHEWCDDLSNNVGLYNIYLRRSCENGRCIT